MPGRIVGALWQGGGMVDRQEAKDAKVLFHEPSTRLDDLAKRVIGAAIEVHRHLGAGFPEDVYELALAVEFELRGIPFRRQPAVQVSYKGHAVGSGRPDFIVGDALVVELKAVTAMTGVHQAQVISYLRALGSELGLLLNFRVFAMRDGIKRVVWGHVRSSNRDQQTRDVNKPHEARDGLVVASSDAPVPLERWKKTSTR